ANDGADGAVAVNQSARRDGERPVREAMHDFMHALFEALRPNRGEGGGNGRGFGWGRTSVADLAQRIERLAQSFATPSAPPPAWGGPPAARSACGSRTSAGFVSRRRCRPGLHALGPGTVHAGGRDAAELHDGRNAANDLE